MKVRGKVTTYEDIEISELELVDALIERYGFEPSRDSFVVVVDDKLVKKEDISYHGSPTYKSTIISEDKDDIDLFNSLYKIKSIIERKENKQ